MKKFVMGQIGTIAITLLFVCFIVGSVKSQDKPAAKPEALVSKLGAKPPVVEAEKPIASLSPVEWQELANMQAELTQLEPQVRQAQLLIQAYQTKSASYVAAQYKAFAMHAKDGVLIEKHDLDLEKKGFFVKKAPTTTTQ